ncbi:MAG TPA: hypothetical protein VFK31_11590 [Rhodanobacteraceae bacterium]|nr:hypothetical protein [Rhodanobacteraceae bacterium]
MNIIGKLAVLAGASVLLGFGVGMPAAHAGTHVSIRIGIAPPPPRWERVPAPRAGFIWAPGYWRWTGAAYIWIGGSWHRHRPGYRYVRPRWHHERGGWRFHTGYWRHEQRHDWRRRSHGDHGRHRGHGRHHSHRR